MWKRGIWGGVVIGVLTALGVGQTVRHVPGAYATVQSAIVAAAPGDTVLVQAGTYVGTVDFLGKPIEVLAAAGAGATILDGNQAGPVVSFVSGETPAAVLDGFTLRNGLGTSVLSVTPSGGGGIHCVNASPTIRNCIVTANFGGGGNLVQTSGFSAIVYVGGAGGPGGVFVRNGAPRLIDCDITGNYGGAGASDVSDVAFPNGSPGQGGAGGAGGLHLVNPGSAIVLEGLRLETNFGGSGGSGSSPSGFGASAGIGGPGGAAFDITADVLSRRLRILGNVGGTAGNATGTGNLSGAHGGIGGLVVRNSIAFLSATVRLSGGVIALNSGGAGTVSLAGGTGGEGGIACSGLVAIETFHLTIAGNAAGPNPNGACGGLTVGSILTSGASLANTIIWGNSAAGIPSDLKSQGVVAVADHCDIGAHNGLSGSGNISADPSFLNLASGDYHLAATSPCRNAGNPAAAAPSGGFLAFDHDGDPRVVGSAPDIGIDEFEALPGTREDLTLAVLVDGVEPDTTPEAQALAGQSIEAVLGSPAAVFATTTVAFLGEIWFPPFPPPSPSGFPEVHVSTSAVVLASLPGVGPATAITATIPPGLAGLTVRLQGFASYSGGINGIFAASAARDIVFL